MKDHGANPETTGLYRYDISLFGNGVVEMSGGKYVLYDDAIASIERVRADTIKECAIIAFNWRTSATVRVGEYIAQAILSLATRPSTERK